MADLDELKTRRTDDAGRVCVVGKVLVHLRSLRARRMAICG